MSLCDCLCVRVGVRCFKLLCLAISFLVFPSMFAPFLLCFLCFSPFRQGSALPLGAVVGIALAGVAVVALVAALLARRRRRNTLQTRPVASTTYED